MTCAYSLFIPCVNYLLHEFWDTDMRMDGYETQLRLAPARDIWDGLAPASDLDADEIWFRRWYMVHVWPPWVLIWVFSAVWITSTDVYLRTDMHHDYMTSLLHLHRIWLHLCLWCVDFTYLLLFMWYMIYLLLYEDMRWMLRHCWIYLLIMNCVV